MGSNAQAGLQLYLNGDGLSPAQQQASQALLDEAMQALPPRFIERLDRRIDVGWTDQMPANAYGQASLVSQLDLNRNLLDSLTDGSAATQKTQRPHGTVRREMLATVLHELTHIYDRSRLWPSAERALIQRCTRRNDSAGLIGLPDECRGQNGRRFTLSDDPRLLDLAGWPQYVGRRGEREQHNRQVARSPDLYETSSPKEFVAVNMNTFSWTRAMPVGAPPCIATTRSTSVGRRPPRTAAPSRLRFSTPATISPRRLSARWIRNASMPSTTYWPKPTRTGSAVGATACSGW